MTNTTTDHHLILVTGGTGKTGSRVLTRLRAAGHPVRVGSRAADIPFDWANRGTWPAALTGVRAVYVAFQPDLAVPGAPEVIRAFAGAAAQAGVRKLVLLSGRGEPEAVQCEQAVRDSGLHWTIMRSSFFAQNFSEGAFTDYILAGELALPNGSVPEPFVHADDIADVAVAALTSDRHDGEIYELTGPRAITFGEAVAEIAAATGRPIAFVPVSRTDFVAGLTESGVPADVVSLLDYLFGTVLDGRNAEPGEGVRRAIGRSPKDFADYVTQTAATGIWNVPAA
ncbi:NAD(P)H-binding protein [Streptomyces gardneri]|uniref:NAD(P)H-binding protein n=1 Tax=Nocardia TaxID=1817 RepID=UPI00135AFEE3|nr:MULTISPECIES: NAD(P)H-binding protein [Nocardia]MBF6168178.1 NAD(P)H-binding protein [Streptomyces gardneri]MBF6204741.1 NAD(P)H-binding protein [Streptomyces gardneri]